MRNYVRADSATIFGNDGFSDQILTYFGQNAAQALAIAQATAAQLIAGGWTSAYVVENPPVNVLLNKGQVTSLLMFPQQGSQPAGGALGQSLFTNLQSICTQIGMDPFVSPKEQDFYPYDGRPKRHFVFKGFPHLI
jgi:hypothetical protein